MTACWLAGCQREAVVNGMCLTDYRATLGLRRAGIPAGVIAVQCPDCGHLCGLVSTRAATWGALAAHRCQDVPS